MKSLHTMPRARAAAPAGLGGDRNRMREAARSRRRRADGEMTMYEDPRWPVMRRAAFAENRARNGGRLVCVQTGVALVGKHPAWNAPIADHITPHRGDQRLFFDAANVQVVSKAYHDGPKKSLECAQRRYKTRPDGLRPSQPRLTIVCGAPSSGKSTYVAEHAGPDDIVIDLDAIVAEMSGGPMHGWDRKSWLAPAMIERNERLASLAESDAPAAWFIVCETDPSGRDWWRKALRPSEVLVMMPGKDECRRRAALDDRASPELFEVIDRWHANYSVGIGETLIQ